MIYELYKGGYLEGLGGNYIDRIIRRVSKNPKECRSYIVFVNGKTKQLKWLIDPMRTYSLFSGYINPKVAEHIIFMECL